MSHQVPVLKRTFIRLSPVLVGVVATLLSGLVNGPILIFNREPTNYFYFYGVPYEWYSVPTSQCARLNEQFHANASCLGGFILFGFLVDIAFYSLLSIPFVCLIARIFRIGNVPSMNDENSLQVSHFSHSVNLTSSNPNH